MIERILLGQRGGVAYALTLSNGGLEIVYGGVEVPADVLEAANAAIAGIKAGEIEVLQQLPE